MKASATTVLKLLQGSKVFVVPRFQRRYDWRLTRWQPFWEDILHEYAAEHDGSQEYDGHFLGSVVLHPAPGPASTLMRHLVIDGQQRLTTLLVLLAALRDVHQELDPDDLVICRENIFADETQFMMIMGMIVMEFDCRAGRGHRNCLYELGIVTRVV